MQETKVKKELVNCSICHRRGRLELKVWNTGSHHCWNRNHRSVRDTEMLRTNTCRAL